MANINIQWNWISWNYGYEWVRDISPQLSELEITESHLDRAVYVIRLNEPFAVKYPKSQSPVLYIGEGNFKSRLSSHSSNWISDLWELIEQFGLTIGIATPRVKNNLVAYKDVEAALIHEFATIYGSAPLNNKQFEYAKIDHSYDRAELRKPLMIGKGKRYKWAIEPMKSNSFHDYFYKTHV